MHDLIKQLFVKDSDLNRRISQSIQAAYLRDSTILICSIVSLVLAIFAWIASYFGFPLDFWSIPLFLAFLFAPVFGVLAALDMLKRERTLKRFLALLCAAATVVVVAYQIYVKICQDHVA
jgi:peptidoglycan/LPS O-acetylase OafA/YrhL